MKVQSPHKQLAREALGEISDKDQQLRGLRGENEHLRVAVQAYERESAIVRLYNDNEKLRKAMAEACERAEQLCRENAVLKESLRKHKKCENLQQARENLRQADYGEATRSAGNE